jgi:hypothetical protein
MEFFTPRKLLFKAWNKETKLLMRLNSIDCKRGELFKKDHILLQFTGLYDKQQDEVYEMDVMLIAGEKHVVIWDAPRNGWNLARLSNPSQAEPFVSENSSKGTRLWNYFEAEKEK